jgi:hypothetical protein
MISFVFGLFIVSHAGTTNSTQMISISETKFDFGEINEGTSVEHSFRVLNKGGKDLEIKRVKTT